MVIIAKVILLLLFISMHVTVDDVNFCDGLECVYVKYKSRASTARELHGVLPVKTWLLKACDTAFYAIICVEVEKCPFS